MPPAKTSSLSDLSDKQLIIVYTGEAFKFYNFYAGTISGGIVADSYISVDYDGAYSSYTFVDGSWVYDGADSSTSSVRVSCVAYGDARYWSNKSLGLSSGGYFFTIVPGSSSVGVFSVFSGVSTWLAGAVNNMVSMFWTAEGGLSVLGVLAVASLAIAFIILLIYLLAGWMKFK